MRCVRALFGIALTCLALGGFGSASSAQEGAKGIPLGGFRLFPTLDLDATYDANVYRTQTAPISDVFFSERPSLLLRSQWGRHELDLHAGFQGFQYSSRTSEDRNDWDVGGHGRLDIVRGVSLSGGASYAILHEARTSPDQPHFAAAPTQYSVTLADAALEYRPYHFGFAIGGAFDRDVYDPTPLIALHPLDNSDRDSNAYTGYVKGSYEFSPGYAMFVQGNIRSVQYDIALDRSGFRRGNSGYSVNAGLDMLVTNLITGQIFVGYLDQHFHAPLTDVQGFNFGANVDWSASPLWTFHLTASRSLNGTTIANASAEDTQTVNLAVDYSILRSVTINAHVGYTDTEFSGTTRDDHYVEGGVGVNYQVNSLITAKLAYDYQNRDSTIGGQAFNDNIVSIGLGLHL